MGLIQEARGKSQAGAIIAVACHHAMGHWWRKSSPSFSISEAGGLPPWAAMHSVYDLSCP